MEEKEIKKSNKGLVIAIIILAICVLGLGGFIVYDKLLKKEEPSKPIEKTPDNEKEPDNLTIDATAEEIETMLNVIKHIPHNVTKAQDFTNQELLYIGYFVSDSKKGSDIKRIIKEMFGREIILEDINCPLDNCLIENKSLIKYDEENDIYTEEHGHGGQGINERFDQVITATKTGNIYTLVTKSVFSNYIEVGCLSEIYKTDEDAYQNRNALLNFEDNQELANKYCPGWPSIETCDFDDYINEHGEDLYTFTYIFTKTDNAITFKNYSYK